MDDNNLQMLKGCKKQSERQRIYGLLSMKGSAFFSYLHLPMSGTREEQSSSENQLHKRSEKLKQELN